MLLGLHRPSRSPHKYRLRVFLVLELILVLTSTVQSLEPLFEREQRALGSSCSTTYALQVSGSCSDDVDSVSECKDDASEDLDISWYSTSSYTTRPSGCYRYSGWAGYQYLYWNTQTTDVDCSSSYPCVCETTVCSSTPSPSPTSGSGCSTSMLGYCKFKNAMYAVICWVVVAILTFFWWKCIGRNVGKGGDSGCRFCESEDCLCCFCDPCSLVGFLAKGFLITLSLVACVTAGYAVLGLQEECTCRYQEDGTIAIIAAFLLCCCAASIGVGLRMGSSTLGDCWGSVCGDDGGTRGGDPAEESGSYKVDEEMLAAGGGGFHTL